MQKITFQDQLTTKDQSHSPPTANLDPEEDFSPGMRTVRPAQLVVLVAEE